MKFQFDSSQPHQQAAISSAIELFTGSEFAAPGLGNTPSSQAPIFSEIGFPNSLSIDNDRLLENLQSIQRRNSIPESAELDGHDFTIEMETGTGKTYVFLRTAFELYQRFGLSKFVIVVPSLAIREGIEKTISITDHHFNALYGNLPRESWTYNSKRPNMVRQFAASQALQLFVINIDSFNSANNLFLKPHDSLGGRRPVDFIAETNPIIIIDEPQNLDTENADRAIARLNPLFTFRYSATHRRVFNLLYRLDPVEAYDLGLVKRIEVDSVLDSPDFAKPFISVEKVIALRGKIGAKVTLNHLQNGLTKKKTFSISEPGQSLEDLSGGLPAYSGLRVQAIDGTDGRIDFSDGLSLYEGEESGRDRDGLMRVQIHQSVLEVLTKERRFRKARSAEERIKVLGLFFIDRVANYVPEDGKIRKWFREAYEEISSYPRFRDLDLPSVDEVHSGYFSETRGRPKDTSGNTEADEDAYALIMRDKERLLSNQNPVRFIFSHSALREGWDNPNVFVICTLNETVSELKKRQEIGRGLRLAVDESGKRVTGSEINRLTVVANESYEEFARLLQQEIEEETGVSFTGRIDNRRDRITFRLKEGWDTDPMFLTLWESVSKRTSFRVKLPYEQMYQMASDSLRSEGPVASPKIVSMRAELDLSDSGVGSTLLSISESVTESDKLSPHHAIRALEKSSGLTRRTIAEILQGSGRLSDLSSNPAAFMERASRELRWVVEGLILKEIEYFDSTKGNYPAAFFNEKEYSSYTSRAVRVTKSIFDFVEVDSDVERDYVTLLEANDRVKFFLKFPSWFKIETPVGAYNPDWGLVVASEESDKLEVQVRETKGTLDKGALRGREWAKVQAGRKHFAYLGVDFEVVTEAVSH